MTLLRVEHLRIVRGDGVPLVDGVSLALDRGERLAIVGESGSGKTLTVLAIIGLLPPGLTATGRILLDGADLLALPEPALCRIRGARVGLVFQEPATALDPVRPIGRQVGQAAALHRGLRGTALRRHVMERLDEVGLPRAIGPERYSHELSGGQRQRVMIASALSADPALILADEPTTALDVASQRTVLELLERLCVERAAALILVTHDLAVAAHAAERLLVLYAGRPAETGPTRDLLAQPAHPYTAGLLAARPGRPGATRRLVAIPGQIPQAGDVPAACAFHPRCPRARPHCREERPVLAAGVSDRLTACHYPLAGEPP